MTSIRYRKADVDGLNVFYREAGRADAPALLLLHGFPTAGHMFRGDPNGTVAVVGHQNLPSSANLDRVQYCHHRRGGVRDQGDAVRVGADERGEVAAGVCESIEQATGEERHRVRVHLVA